MNFQDYDYTYICNDSTRESNEIIIEEDMIFLLQGYGNILSILRDILPDFIRHKLEFPMATLEFPMATLEFPMATLKTLEIACLELDSLIQRSYQAKGYASMSGIIRYRNELYILHVGDCNITLFNGIIATHVSSPHSMKNKNERKRISSSTFIHRNKAEGLFKLTRCFGNYHLKRELYRPLPHVERIDSRITHVFLYSRSLKIKLAELITTVLTNKDKASTAIINRNMSKGNICLICLHLPIVSSSN